MGNANVRCPQCGLVNFVAATECRRCHAPLSAAAGDRTVFDPANPSYVPEKLGPRTSTVGLPDYKTAVPWSRRSSTNTAFLLIGWFLCPLLTLWCCFNLLTGEIYYDTPDGQGGYRVWSRANKIAALILAGVWVVGVIIFIAER
ncbi:MAG TPA: hypothetical protein VLX28_17285 [Thermoanaerobaculia bacterium]|nr:hypothetical protein [Thermoanaerobaculia bacterium]